MCGRLLFNLQGSGVLTKIYVYISHVINIVMSEA
jgi:hypothetical protein